MLSISKSYFFGYALMFFSGLSFAETGINNALSSSPQQRISLHQAINDTLLHNPALKSFSYEISAQKGREYQAGLSRSPEVNFTLEDALGTGEFNGVNSAQATISIGWVLEGKVRQGFKGVAVAGSLALSNEVKNKQLDAAAETARLFLICLANQARRINADNTVKLASDTVVAVKKRVSAGNTPAAELLRAEADLTRKQLDRENIIQTLTSALHLLAAQWGEIHPEFMGVEGDIFQLPTPLTFEAFKNRLQSSPNFLRLLSDKRLKQAQLTLAQSKSEPEWRVNMGMRHFESINEQTLVAGISIPFGERSRNEGGIRAAREKVLQTQALQYALKVEMETTLFILYQALQHNMRRVYAYRNKIIPNLEKALTQTRSAYDLGRYSYFEWRSVQAELLNARTSLIEDSMAAHLKVIEIERLTGATLVKITEQK
ncbi:hypothetical protein MNBD_GAMMA07-1263 [hydrothermal vent metagenome]|uniref:Heavy metal RND efflux outer membrane protein, CzcC family n=1 Tax=hydrothermal vent metagenome TaxID=652676 RepID=A0A3B0X5J7_9ZZZZ